ncbi:MAG: DUF362 domain-containing protein [Candidatus Verstraetearchaeota archaeon]|nr:DUF362 domain-containing protein [Candidatus Verstraetearchaeota archaeon]
MSDVYFFSFERGDVLDGIGRLLETCVGSSSDRGRNKLGGKRVAIKAHFGELGNYTHIRPAFVRRVVDYVKEAGGDPFATETTALYPEGARVTVEESLRTAAYNGFTSEGLGCPIVIADGPDGYNGVQTLGGRLVKKVKVARSIADSDSLIVLSHVKGHVLSGMGGAIKNLAMGCTTKDCKREQHKAHGIVFNSERCVGCGECAEVCRFEALKIVDERPVWDWDKCFYCSTCRFNCKYGAIEILENGKENFQIGMAEAAAGVMKAMEGKATVFLNFIFDVTPMCDCAAPAGRLVVQNVGVLASKDPVAIDSASIDLIDSAELLPSWKVTPPDVLGKINETDSWIHIREAEALGLGSRKYSLVMV